MAVHEHCVGGRSDNLLFSKVMKSFELSAEHVGIYLVKAGGKSAKVVKQ
jgi:hypothetical protein